MKIRRGQIITEISSTVTFQFTNPTKKVFHQPYINSYNTDSFASYSYGENELLFHLVQRFTYFLFVGQTRNEFLVTVFRRNVPVPYVG